jgi:hypothetical protein
MKRSELKKIIKPLVVECINEALLSEQGVLSSIVSEVAKGISSAPVMTEQKHVEPKKEKDAISSLRRNRNVDAEMQNHRKSLMDSLGRDSYGGVNLFEGVDPAPEQRSAEYSAANPLASMDPGDAGVDISGIMALGGANWKELIK